ncbi:MAG: hypothetical protein G8345_21975 [Magnetococcales bacterium]|nr:hypothetical protein [Magnetococcales bacterium]NGZ29544.1 hypothetical protein [Magnetococcales bacterium]
MKYFLIFLSLAGSLSLVQADSLATLGTESYPSNLYWQRVTPITVGVGPNYWSTTPVPYGLPPAVWVHPMTGQPAVPGYVGVVPAPVFVNYQLWQR